MHHSAPCTTLPPAPLCPPPHPLLGSGLTDQCWLAASDTCLYSEPTALRQELPMWNGAPAPHMRLDYALVNGPLATALPSLHCRVAHDEVTATLSDHFPILCEALP
jgi:hypothetical protein